MIALSLETAKAIAIVVVIAFVVLSVISALVIKSIVTKLIVAVLLACLALGVWTQRTNLQHCADRAQATSDALAVSGLTCTFFGTEIQVG